MKNEDVILGLLGYITNEATCVSILPGAFWREMLDFRLFGSTKGNGIRSIVTNNCYHNKYQHIGCPEPLKVSCRKGQKLLATVTFRELFSDTPVLVVTENNQLRLLVPMFKRRSDMMEWLHLVCDHVSSESSKGNPIPDHWEEEMLELARFVFYNSKDTVRDESPFDENEKIRL